VPKRPTIVQPLDPASAVGAFPPVVAHVGQYEIVRRLGLGTTSEVLLARAIGPFELERIVVIKRLLPNANGDEMRERRFAREAVAVARLNHPAIVRLYDVLAGGGDLALVLEYVEGASLRALVEWLAARGERLDDAAGAFVAARIFAALEAAHEAQDPVTGRRAPVIHRDVTPSNVVVPWDGFAKLTDFGIAKVTGLSSDTRVGILKGTYGYMAPEQVIGEPVTISTDVYQACLVLYELLTGRAAFARATLSELELLHAMAEGKLFPLELSRPDVAPAVGDALRRGLHVDPAARTLTPTLMLHVLRTSFDMERGRASLGATLQRMRGGGNVPACVSSSSARRSIHPWTLQVLRSTRPDAMPLSASTTDRTSAVFDTPRVHRPVLADLVPQDVTPTAPEALPTVRPPFFTPPAEAIPPAMRDSRVSRPELPPPPRVPNDEFAGMRSATLHPARGSRATAVKVALIVAASLASLGTLGAFMFVRATRGPLSVRSGSVATRASSASAAPTLRPEPTATSAPGATASAPSAAASAPRPATTTGILRTPADAAGHRVFIDGLVACSGGEPCTLRCGPHTVLVGSRGRAQRVEVPCGAELSIGH